MADRDYIIMLKESLEQKVAILTELQLLNREQAKIFKDVNSDPEDWEANIEAKAKLIERIEELDDGFESVYNRVKGVLSVDKESYADEIRTMQELIRQVSDLTADVEAMEYKNRDIAKARFAQIKKDIREVKKSSAAVNNYYKSMTGTGVIDPQFMDRKK